ncbi:hypothetical protein AVEN_45503-1, partial [Araneus ventricosus]
LDRCLLARIKGNCNGDHETCDNKGNCRCEENYAYNDNRTACEHVINLHHNVDAMVENTLLLELVLPLGDLIWESQEWGAIPTYIQTTFQKFVTAEKGPFKYYISVVQGQRRFSEIDDFNVLRKHQLLLPAFVSRNNESPQGLM